MQIAHLKQQLKALGIRFPIYLDSQSTTPVDPRVLEDMLPYFAEKFGNSGSNHTFGFEADAAIELARQRVASTISASKESIIFTSSATESNNLALFGVVDFCSHIITLVTEHSSVLKPLRQLEKIGMRVTYLPVQGNGLVDLDILNRSITSQTLVSIMALHNEIGVIQPLEEIGAICQKHNAIFHSDIAQSFGKIPIDVEKYHIDLASISGHKIYGPKGIGALYIRNGLKLKPLMYGGGQECGLRSSTLATPLIVGFGRAAEIASQEMDKNYQHIKKLYDMFLGSMPNEVTLNGNKDKRWPGNVNITLPCAFIHKDLAISSGAACSSGSADVSYTLRALGLSDEAARRSIRISFGRGTMIEEVKYAILTILSNLNL